MKVTQKDYINMLNECATVEELKRRYPHWNYRDTPAQMIKYNDPIMFRCEFLDWEDAQSRK